MRRFKGYINSSKKYISFVLVVAFMLGIFFPSPLVEAQGNGRNEFESTIEYAEEATGELEVDLHFDDEDSEEDIEESLYSFQVDGFGMSVSDFQRAFTGDPRTRMMARTTLSTGISFEEVIINGDNISFIAIFQKGDETIELPVNGTISSGNRSENSIVIDVQDETNGYEFLLFEINDDPQTANLLLRESENVALAETSHMKIYLLDEFDFIYLFEAETPEIFSSLKAENFDDLEHADDLLWVMDFATPVIEELEADAEMLAYYGLVEEDFPSLARGQNVWTTHNFATIFTATVTSGQDKIIHTARPSFRRTHQNIGRNSEVTFGAAFRVTESIQIKRSNGTSTTVTNGTNEWTFRNVRLGISVGANTDVLSYEVDGRMLERRPLASNIVRQTGDSVSSFVVNKAAGTVPSLALTIIRNSVRASSSTNVKLGGTARTLNSGHHRLASQQLGSNFWIRRNSSSSNGHFFTLHARVRRWGTGAAISNTGAVRATFDVYWGGNKHGSNRSWDTTFTYDLANNR